MAYIVTKTKAESLAQLKRLVAAFEKGLHAFTLPTYVEAQLRIDFINPLLKTFGWDVDNEAGKTQFLRDIVQEEGIDIEDNDIITKKNPDYTLRIQGIRKLFIEAKKVAIDIENSSKASFQTRRYGWNANLRISILTNFERIVVYDCRQRPDATDDPSVARYKNYHYKDFVVHFDELYSLLSYESVAAGYVDEYFAVVDNETVTFDWYFLQQIENWRKRLAIDIIKNRAGLTEPDINFLTQRLLNRIIFLRICEDREIEKYATLKSVKSYEELKQLFIRADKKYNSELFAFIEDTFDIVLDSVILLEIFVELYYPESPYDFSVVDPTILSQIYERFLGSSIRIVDSPERIVLAEVPEVAASNGVVPTPKHIVENIVKETLQPLLANKRAEDIASLKIADICCGSGTFLLSVFSYLQERVILALVGAGISDQELIYPTAAGVYQLTLKTKTGILLNNIYGVDINPYAVEVTRFSLLLKLIENENAASVDHYLATYKQQVLPKLDNNIKTGNSLVDNKFYDFDPDVIHNDEVLYKVKPFDWPDEFPFLTETKGFDAIVGNPPYVRIQNLVKYVEEEIKYYQWAGSGYTVAHRNTFDKYYLFIKRSIELLNSHGVLGYIVPNKFFIVKGATALRSFIVEHSFLFKIVHFGVTQVFPSRSTYTAVLLLTREEKKEFGFKRIGNIYTEFIADYIDYAPYSNADFKAQPWVFVSKPTDAVFRHLRSGNVIPLKMIATIPVGLQTSADDIYIIKPEEETPTTYRFTHNSKSYEVEKSICRPCIYDLSFNLFDTIQPNAQIIFPYVIQGDRAEVYDETQLQNQFPLTWMYLNEFKDKLSKRSITGGSRQPKWYQFGRSQSLTKFDNAPKLIWSVLSKGPTYVYDERNILFTGGGNGPYYSLISNGDYSPLYILAILSHPVIEMMVRAGASEFRGAYYSHGKQFIEHLPIRRINFDEADERTLHDNIVETINAMMEVKERFKRTIDPERRKVIQRRLDSLSQRITMQVNHLYGLNDEAVSIVVNDDMFDTDLNED